ncbi:Os01g0366201 [Oryza sativa Japonica Group]|uniref:Os01g0366201 protein n=2 Tax=Oryza TaxID=4527 RepID=A0A0N7KCY8_ORYSJ|nr:Os01g0366201 [Oryza sativa Japonica Group]
MASSNSWMNAPPPPPTPSTLSLSPHTTASSTLHVALVVVLCVAALAGALLFSIVLHIVYTKWLKPRIFARAAPPPPSQEVVVQMPPFSRGLASVKKLIGR